MKLISMIGNTHFDPVWLWRWNEGLASITATFRSALERMKEDPDFIYSFSSPAVFEWIRETNLPMFEEIKARIAQGRWELAEGWWIQADCNIASGESYVRQGLYAQLYYEEHFGKKSDTLFNIDSFGHPATLPQILSKCGIKNYVFSRPKESQMHLPQPLFRWMGEDNTSILAYRSGGSGGASYSSNVGTQTLDPIIADSTPHDIMAVYGVSDHGGAPTKAAIAAIKQYAHKYKGAYKIQFDRIDGFFEAQEPDKLPKIKDELQVTFIGPYNNHIEVKKNNRLAEYCALNAEKFSVLAEYLLKKSYPHQKLRDCWKDIMFNQFHDILGGASIEEAYFDARNLHGRTLQNATELLYFNLQSITNKIKMPGRNPDNAWNLVVWNLNCFESDFVIEAEAQWEWEFEGYIGGIVLIDEKGQEYPCQIIRESCVLPKFRTRFVFHAVIPALGYKTFIIKQTHTPVCLVEDPQKKLENKRYVVELNNNGFGKVFDKLKGAKVCDSLVVPYAVYDDCDTWGFNKTVFERGKYYFKLESSQITENGLLRTTMKRTWKFGSSTLELYVTLYDDFIRLKYRVNWNEKKYALKFLVSPINDAEYTCRASAPYGFIERGASEYERPMGEWIELREDEYGISIAADSIFAYGFNGKSLGLTALRNCIYGDLRRDPLDETGDYRYMGQGITEGTMSVFFGSGVHIAKEAAKLNNPPLTVLEANHDGDLPSSKGFLSTDMDDFLITAVKKAEKTEHLILRGYDTAHEKNAGKISLFEKEYPVIIRPGEIKTLQYQDETLTEVSMLETDF